MSVHPTIERYVDELPHLLGAREDEPLHIPTADEIYQLTGKRLIAEDYYQYFENTPFNLELGSGPVAIGGFTWSNLWVDNMANADLTSFFTTPVIIGENTVYNSWRVRGLWRGGYLLAYYATNPNPSYIGPISAMGVGNQGFSKINNGWALGYTASQNLIVKVGNQYFFNGGNQDIWFPIHFQIELGYGDPNFKVNEQAGNLNWPAFTAGIGTDLLGYRGYNPNWACFNGFANAPNVIALGGCPYTGIGGYVPPDPPPDL